MEENVYQPPRSAPDPAHGRSDELSFGNIMNMGWSGYTRNLGMGLAACILLLLMFAAGFVVVACIIGLGAIAGGPAAVLLGVLVLLAFFLFAGSHIWAGFYLSGFYMARDRLALGDMFGGFKKYWPTLGASLLYILCAIPILVAFSFGPLLYFFYSNFDPATMGDPKRIEEFSKLIQSYGYRLDVLGFGLLGGVVMSYLQARLVLIYPLIVERNMSALEAFGGSWRATAKSHMAVFAACVAVQLLYSVYGLIGPVLHNLEIASDTTISILGLLGIVWVLMAYPLAFSIYGAASVLLIGSVGSGASR